MRLKALDIVIQITRLALTSSLAKATKQSSSIEPTKEFVLSAGPIHVHASNPTLVRSFNYGQELQLAEQVSTPLLDDSAGMKPTKSMKILKLETHGKRVPGAF